VVALVVFGACVTVSAPAISGPGVATLPPGVSILPIPSIAIPSIAIPSIAIPSIAIPSIAIPSIAIPSLAIPSIGVPSLGTGGDCSILSSAKANAATGITWTFASETPGACTFIDTTFSTPISTFNVRNGTSETIATAKLIDAAGTDLNVAGHAAFWGPLFHQLYVDLGGDTLVILIPTTDNAAGLELAQKVANAYFAP
jgi:hypothetical protein